MTDSLKMLILALSLVFLAGFGIQESKSMPEEKSSTLEAQNIFMPLPNDPFEESLTRSQGKITTNTGEDFSVPPPPVYDLPVYTPPHLPHPVQQEVVGGVYGRMDLPLDFPVSSKETVSETTGDTEDSILLNFIDTDLGVVLKTMSDFLGRTFLVSPKANSKITVINPEPLKPKKAWDILLSVLELSGLSVVQNGEVVHIFPREQISEYPEGFRDSKLGDSSVVTKIIEIKHWDASELAKLLQGYTGNGGWSFSVDTRLNQIVFSGLKKQIDRLLEIVQKLDQDKLAIFKPHFYRLKYGQAKKIAGMIKRIYSGKNSSGAVPGQSWADSGTGSSSAGGSIADIFDIEEENILVVMCSQVESERLSSMISFFDVAQTEHWSLREHTLLHSEVFPVMEKLKLFLDEKTSGPDGMGTQIRQIRGTSFVIIPNATQTSIVVYANQYQHERIAQLIEKFDQIGMISGRIQKFPIRHSDPSQIVQKLKELYPGMGDLQNRFVADLSKGLIYVFCSSQKQMDAISSMIMDLDQEESYRKMVNEVFYLENSDPKEVDQALKGFFQNEIKEGITFNVVPGEQTSSLVIGTNPQMMPKIRDLISKLDQPVRQILVEVLIVEALLDKNQSLGMEWSWEEGKSLSATNMGIAKNPQSVDIFPNLVGFRQSFLNPGGFQAFLHALKSSESVKIVATPRLWASNNKEASFLIGDQVPVKTSESQNTVGTVNSYAYQDVGIKLNIKPRVTKSGKISLDIQQEIKTLRGTGSSDTGGNPIIQTREVKTIATVDNGHTIVIGGLIREDSNSTRERVPVASEIPVVGNLFKKNTKSNVKTEMLIFFTPSLMSTQGKKV